MKIKYILLFTLLFIFSNVKAQYSFINYVSDSAREYIGSYTNTFLYKLKDSYLPDSAYMRIEGNFGILRARSIYNDGSPNSILWTDSYGWVKRSPITAISITMSQIIAGLGYSPIGIEIDPTVPNYVKTITSISINNWNTVSGLGDWSIQGYITSNSSNTLTNKSGNISQWTNNVPYLITEIDGNITNEIQSISLNNNIISLSGSNSITLPLITQSLTSVGINSGDFIISNSPLTVNGFITSNLSTTGIISGTYIGATTFDTKGRAISSRNPSFNNITLGGRNLNQAYSISGTSFVDIKFSGSISCNLSLTGGQAGEIYLEKSANGTTGWVIIGIVPSSNIGTLTIGLNTTQVSGGQLSTLLPPGYFWRFRTNNTTGTPTFTFLGGEEITY